MQISTVSNFVNPNQKTVTDTKKIAETITIENVPSTQPSVGEIAADVGLSLIPVYGTIREFQKGNKGNIGWGIFGIATDLLSLVPVVGYGVKAASTAIRGGATAVKAAKTIQIGLAAGQAVSKVTTMTVVRQFTVGASEGLAKTSADLGKAALRAVDPGVELLYEGGKFVGKQATKVSGSIAVTTTKAVNSVSILENSSRWKDFSSSIARSGDAMNDMRKDFDGIKSTSELSQQFVKDFPRSVYKVDGKVIPTSDLIGLEKAIPDIRKRQFLSAHANQTILADPSEKILLSDNLLGKFVFDNSKPVVYKVKNLANGDMKLTTKFKAKLKAIDPSELAKGEMYSSMGIKVKAVLSESKLAEPQYAYILN